jgi:cytidyltransferase-like protein
MGVTKRPWGYMVTLFKTKSMWVKFIHAKGRLSLQNHKNRTEYHLGFTKVLPGEKHRLQRGMFFELATGKPTEEDIVRYEDDYNRLRVVVASGYFNPLHSGHVKLLEEARKLGDYLIVIVNNDKQVKLKGSVPFMKEGERMKIVSSLKCVDEVVLSIDKDRTVVKTLASIPNVKIFAKGGDSTPSNVPEIAICEAKGIELVLGVGGKKTQSSSWLIKNARN